MHDLRQRTLRAGLAKSFGQTANFVLRMGSLIILARLLQPRDFGVVAMVTAFTGLLNLFREFGLSAVTVQRTTISDKEVSTLFWMNLLIGILLTGLTLVAAPVIVRFYNESSLFWVTVALAGSFLINAVGVQHSALLERQMRFGTLAILETFSMATGIAVAIGMAFQGFGYWALVGMTLVNQLVYSVSVWLSTGWTPGTPQTQGVRRMFRFGGTVTLNKLIEYVACNLDKVLVGRFWGVEALGIYGRAYQLINVPTDNLNSAVGVVAFAALSKIKDDPCRFKRYFLTGYSLVITLTVPITISFALFSNDLVIVVLGQKWHEAAPIFRLLSPTILIYGIINPLWWMLLSLGMVGRSLKIGFVQALLVIIGYLLGVPHGPEGVALGFSMAMTLWVIPHLIWCIRGTPINLKDIMLVLYRPLFSAALAAAVVWVVLLACPQSLSKLARLLVEMPCFTLTYIVLLLYVMKQKYLYASLIRMLPRSVGVER